MFVVSQDQQAWVKEDLFGFARAHARFIRAFIPVEADNPTEIDHFCILA